MRAGAWAEAEHWYGWPSVPDWETGAGKGAGAGAGAGAAREEAKKEAMKARWVSLKGMMND